MDMDSTFKGLVIAVVVCLLGLGIASFFGYSVPALNPQLEAWTKWAAAVLGILVSARVLWAGANFLQKHRG